MLESLFNEVIQKRLWHKRFPVNFYKIFNSTFIARHLRVIASSYHPDTLLKRDSDTGFPVNFAKILTTLFSPNNSERLLLVVNACEWNEEKQTKFN